MRSVTKITQFLGSLPHVSYCFFFLYSWAATGQSAFPSKPTRQFCTSTPTWKCTCRGERSGPNDWRARSTSRGELSDAPRWHVTYACVQPSFVSRSIVGFVGNLRRQLFLTGGWVLLNSGVTRGLIQGGKLSWKGPTGHCRRPTSQHSKKLRNDRKSGCCGCLY